MTDSPRLIYVAGPYRASTRWGEECNVRRAEIIGHMVAALGAYPVIPHANTRPYFADAQPGPFWLAGTLELLRRCDAVVLVADWGESAGARAERAEAERLGIPVFDGTPALGAWLAQADREGPAGLLPDLRARLAQARRCLDEGGHWRDHQGENQAMRHLDAALALLRAEEGP